MGLAVLATMYKWYAHPTDNKRAQPNRYHSQAPSTLEVLFYDVLDVQILQYLTFYQLVPHINIADTLTA
jgi:hypothetical protein